MSFHQLFGINAITKCSPLDNPSFICHLTRILLRLRLMRAQTYILASSIQRSFSIPCSSSIHTPTFAAQSLSFRFKFQAQRARPSRQFSNMSSIMPAQHGHSEACCNLPPVVAKGYQPKGKYETMNGMKACAYYLIATTYEDLILFLFRCNRDIRHLKGCSLHHGHLRILPAKRPRRGYSLH
jgi:hypothetical protein